MTCSLRPVKFGGHCYLTVQCETQEMAGGIVMPDIIQDYSYFMRVLSIGAMVGTRCSEDFAKSHGRPMWLDDQVNVGDLLFVPSEHRGCCRLDLEDDVNLRNGLLHIFEEHCPLAIYRDGEFTPIGRKVMVEMTPPKQIGGVCVPEKRNPSIRPARVIAVGRGSRNIDTGELVPPHVSVGDQVWTPAFDLGVKIGDMESHRDLRIFEESAIMAVIAEGAA